MVPLALAAALASGAAAADWNAMSAHEQYLAVVAGLDVVPDPKPIHRTNLAQAVGRDGPGPIVQNHPWSSVLANDPMPGKSVVQSSCIPGVNDRSKLTGEINTSCYWHEGSQTGNPNLRGHPILGPTDHENHFWHGLHTPATTTQAPTTQAPTRGAGETIEFNPHLSVKEHTAICHAKDITSCVGSAWCIVKADAKAGEQVCVFDESKRDELVAPVQHPQCRAPNLPLYKQVNAANNVCCHYACGQCNEDCTTGRLIVPFSVIDDNIKKCAAKEELACTYRLTKGFCTWIAGSHPRCEFNRDFTKVAIEQAEAEPENSLAVHQGMSNKFHRANCCAPDIREKGVTCNGHNVPCVLKAVAAESGI